MPFLKLSTFLLLCLIFTPMSQSAVDVYNFDTESQRQRYHRLVEELRCPKCQNQNLAGSNSQIATDLRREIHRLLKEGKTDGEIRQFMVNRYGDFVLYKPPLKKSTVFLWLSPVLLMLIGIMIITFLIRKSRLVTARLVDEKPELSLREQDNLDNLLNRK